jgi:TRAP-type C4-dicarboxylate transport system permease small subunit
MKGDKRVSIPSLIWDGSANVQKWILFGLSLFLVIMLNAASGMRYLFDKDLFGAEELILLAAFWLYFLGASIGSYERSHITADILTMLVKSQKAKAVIAVINSVLTSMLLLYALYWGFNFFVWGIVKLPRTPILHLPIVYAQSSVFIGFVMMTYYSLGHLVNDIKELKRVWRKSGEADESF